MNIRLSDFTKYQRRLLARLDSRSGWRPNRFTADGESDLRVLAAFGLVDLIGGHLTDIGRRLCADGELN